MSDLYAMSLSDDLAVDDHCRNGDPRGATKRTIRRDPRAGSVSQALPADPDLSELGSQAQVENKTGGIGQQLASANPADGESR